MIVAISSELGAFAQIVLRWHVQLGVLPVPKSATASRRVENLAIADFELIAEHMQAIGGLPRPHGRIFGADPATHEEF